MTDDDFNIIGRGRKRTPVGAESDEIISEMAAAAKMAVENAGLQMSDIADVGIAAPGTINSETGYIEYSNNIKFKNYPAVQKLKELLGADKCYIANDANAAAYGELLAGAGKGCKDFVAVTPEPVWAAESFSTANSHRLQLCGRRNRPFLHNRRRRKMQLRQLRMLGSLCFGKRP